MSTMWSWFRKRSRRDDELSREIRSHLDLESEEQVESGRSPEEAHHAARRAFGNTTVVVEDTRAAWGWTSLERFWQDIRYGARVLGRSPGFSAVAIMTLAIGIGANTAIFSVIDGVLLRPLPFHDPDRIVRLWESQPAKGVHGNVVNAFNFLDWRERNRSFEQVAAISYFNYSISGNGDPISAPALQVSPAFFSILGVPPLLGRTFLPDDAIQGHDDKVILSFDVWQSYFGADRSIVGSKIMMAGGPWTVVGVMPAGFQLPNQKVKVWVPMGITRSEVWKGGRFLTVVARLKRGVTMPQAQDDMTTIGNQTAKENPTQNAGWNVDVVPMLDDATAKVRLPLLILLCAVGFVLLIACANVANLLLMRASGRTREIAVRAALGAGRVRIMRQFLSESLLLGIAGWIVALPVAYWSLAGLLALIPVQSDVPRIDTISLDSRVLAVGFVASIFPVLLFGLIPAVRASRFDVQDALKLGSVRTGGNRLFRHAFVVTEVALALLLLIGAGLMARSFTKLVSVPAGFDTERVLTLRIFMSPGKYLDKNKRSGYLEHVLAEIRNTPGVRSAGSVSFLPLTGGVSGSCFGKMDEPQPTPSTGHSANMLVVSPGYFEVMSTPLIAGRRLDNRDQMAAQSVVMVNQTFVRRYFDGQNPVGKQLNVCWPIPNPASIIGVVGDARQTELSADIKPTIFINAVQAPMFFSTIVVRAAGDPRQISSGVQAAVHRVDREQAITDLAPMEQVFSESVARPRFQLVLLGVFAGIAVLLAMIGVYGVVSYSAGQRTREIGIRMALGARRRQVTRLILQEGAILTLIGIGIGLAAGLGLTRWMESVLFEVTPTDPLTLTAVSCLLLVVAGVAAFMPARRASRLDPTASLRYE